MFSVAPEYLACISALDALSASSDDPAMQSAIDEAAVRDVVAGNYGNQLTTQQLEKFLRATGYGLAPVTLN